jgi:tetratricopeptide (TPR) repeat protein
MQMARRTDEESARSDVLVGRTEELDQLRHALEDALSSMGRLVLISGEPGIGKSRIASEIARISAARGAFAVWGRCWEAGGAPSYWPWVQSLRALIRNKDPEELRRLLGSGATIISQVLPEITEMLPDSPVPASTGDPEAARFRLFDEVAEFLRRTGVETPLVMVLEDVQAADVPSLLLLQFLSTQLESARILLVVTYRDTEIDRSHSLAPSLVEIARAPICRRIGLHGLSHDDVATYIERSTGVVPSSTLVAAIHSETEGNPLFVGEIVALLASEDRLKDARDVNPWRLRIPEGLREVIGSRLGQLSSESSTLLEMASVLGRDFRVDVLENVSKQTSEELLNVIEEAIAARIITDVPGAPGYLRFSHALIRDALYERLSPPRRVRLHRRTGEVTEALVGDHPDYLSDLARHFFEAVPGGDVDKAVVYARRAAEQAMRSLAFEEAVRLYEMSLHALELEEDREEATRCDILVALGEARMRAGDADVAKETLREAADLARELHRPEAFARAAVGFGGRIVWVRASGDTLLVQLLEEALEMLPNRDGELRCRVLARLACAKRDDADSTDRDNLSRQAVEMATRMDDPATLAYSLSGRYAAILSPISQKERLDIANRLIAVAVAAGDKERELEGRMGLFGAQAEVGDMDAARFEYERSADLSDELGQPTHTWTVALQRANLAHFEGRYAEAEELAQVALQVGRTVAAMDATFAYRVQMFLLRRDQGRVAEMEDLLKRSAKEWHWYPFLSCLRANLSAQLDHEAEAREVFGRLADSEFNLPLDNPYLFGLSFLPEVVRYLNDKESAAILYDKLLPYADRNPMSAPEAMTGSLARGLGILSATQERWADADEHFKSAMTINDRMGAKPWLTRTQYDYARMLLSRDAPGDQDLAVDSMRRAQAKAAEIGMTALLDDIAASLERTGVPTAVSTSSEAAPTGSPVAHHLFRKEGEYWSVAYERDRFRLKDTKGLRYLAALLGEPHREWHVLDLVAADSVGHKTVPLTSSPEGPTAIASGDAGAFLDPEAKAAYKKRLDQLEDDIAEADAFGDFERASRAQEEREYLIRELAGAVGLGGRDRKAASAAERARVNVTRAIKSSLGRIAQNSPALGRHLSATVHTGTFCSYTPDPRSPVGWSDR